VFLGLTAASWSALAAVATVVVYVLLLVYAVRQVGEARTLREDQARPFVLVDFTAENFTAIVIANTGRTAARDVRVKFDPPLASGMAAPWDWTNHPAFSDSGMSILAPGREYRLGFDSLLTRSPDLPRRYKVTITYDAAIGKRKPKYSDEYVLDLTNFDGVNVPRAGLPEIASSLDKIGRALDRRSTPMRGAAQYESMRSAPAPVQPPSAAAARNTGISRLRTALMAAVEAYRSAWR